MSVKYVGHFKAFIKKYYFEMRILSYFYVIDFFCCKISGSDIIELYEKLKNNYDIDIPGLDFQLKNYHGPKDRSTSLA